MKWKNLLFITWLFTSIALLTSCQTKQSVDNCIPPPVKWEFPVMATITTNSIYDLQKEILPSGNWQAESSLPQTGYVYNLVSHNNELWIFIDNDLFMYSISAHHWEKVSSVENFPNNPKSVYVTKEGTLWGIDLSMFDELENEDDIPMLMIYEEAGGYFKLIEDIDGILNSGMNLVAITESTTGGKGEIWMLLVEEIGQEDNYSLVSFNPKNQKVTQHYSIKTKIVSSRLEESLFTDLAITDDGKVWIADNGKQQLLYYDPSSSEINIYLADPGDLDGISGEDFRDLYNLYVDRIGRLWIDDRGFLDFSNPKNPMWHKIIRSPVFISDVISPENQYGWVRPIQMYQSSNGLFWFSADGMVSLDPSTGEWCKFTTGSSPITEDNQGNLWIAVYGILYKYPLNQ